MVARGSLLRSRIDRFCRDRRSGAAELARTAAGLLTQAIAIGYEGARLENLRIWLLEAHPDMAPVWHAVHHDEPARFAEDLERAAARTVRVVRRRLPRRARVVTLSWSSTVVAILSRRDFRVSVAESRPGGEGRKVVRHRSRLGLATTLIPDAALGRAVRNADAALVGADAVTPHHVVNKVGTLLLALACRHAGVPCLVAADRFKRVPASWPLPEGETLFEATPTSLFSAVLSDME